MKLRSDPPSPWPPGIRRAGLGTLSTAIVLLVWSNVVWNLYGYDFPMHPFPVAAIGGWFFGWMVLAVAALLLVVDYIRRRRA